MECTKFLGRVGGFAVGLGIGSALAALPWMRPLTRPQLTPDIGSAIDVLPFAAAAAGSTPDFAISYDGMSLLQEGTATATTVAGDYGLAIAYGDGSRALDNGMYEQLPSPMAPTARHTSAAARATSASPTAPTASPTSTATATSLTPPATRAMRAPYSATPTPSSPTAPAASPRSWAVSNDLVTVYGANSLADTGNSNDVLASSATTTARLHPRSARHRRRSSVTAVRPRRWRRLQPRRGLR